MARWISALGIVLLSSLHTWALRRARGASRGGVRSNATVDSDARASSGSGYINKLYTWGAPAILRGRFLPDLRRSDGCWQGERLVTIRSGWTGTWYVDIVQGLTNAVNYYATNQVSIKYDDKGNANSFPCGDDASPFPWIEVPSVSLHMQNVYEERADTLSGDAVLLTKYFVTASYMEAAEAASYTAPSGYNLVGSSIWERKETHLFQHPSSLDCILSFQGTTSDRVLDWWDNIRFYDVRFCGVGDRVHGGFKGQLMAIVQTDSYTTEIQNKMGSCKSVTAVGHSLGGALASLFSYCVNAAPAQGSDGYDDYKHMMWSWSAVRRLDPVA